MKLKKQSENDVVKGCLSLLAACRIPAWRINNVGIFDQAKGRYRFNGTHGIPDILGLLPKDGGQFLGVECKHGKNKPSEAQTAILETINQAGGLGVVVWSVDDLASVLRDMGYLK